MTDWNSTMPGFNQSVPQNAYATESSSSSDSLVSNILETISKPIPDSVINAATLPSAGNHAVNMPTNIATPVAPYQERPLDQRRVVGKGNAGRQGVANAFTAAGNALGTIVTKEAQIKQGHIRDAAQKVIMAQQGIDEAKQALEAAHAAGDTAAVQRATQLIQQNQQSRDAVFADPKMRKALTKGFDISYTDPSSNKTEEHAAVQEALKSAKTFQEKREMLKQQQATQNTAAGQAAGAAFEKAAPQRMAPNIPAQAKLSAMQLQQKNMIEGARALVPYFSAQVAAGSRMSVQQMRGAIELRTHAIDYERDIEKMQMEMQMHAADRAAARSLEVLKSSLEMQRKAAEEGNPNKIMEAFQTSSKNLVDSLDKNQKSRQALNDELDKKPTQSRQEEIRRQLTALDSLDAVAKNSFEAGKNFAVKMSGLDVKQFDIQVPVPHVGEGVSGASTGSNSSSSADIDPRSGKLFKSNVSAADRIIIKTFAGLSSLYGRGEQATGDLGRLLDSEERSLERDPNESN